MYIQSTPAATQKNVFVGITPVTKPLVMIKDIVFFSNLPVRTRMFKLPFIRIRLDYVTGQYRRAVNVPRGEKSRDALRLVQTNAI